MILGNEMAYLQRRIMTAAIRAIRDESEDGGRINVAARDAIVRKGVYKYVYSVYQPTVYNRRYDGGGLADNDNLYTNTIGGPAWNETTIEIEDRTEANGDGRIIPDPVTYLSDIIESGAHGERWPDPDWPGARPYMEQSLVDESSGQIDSVAADVVEKMPTVF